MAYKDVEKQKLFQREWQRSQRAKRRLHAIKLMGGKCVDCGNADHRVLQFDHIDPIFRSVAERGITAGNNLIAQLLRGKVAKEKLRLRCANCHQIKTYSDRTKFKNYKA